MFCDDHSFIDVKRMERLHDLIVERGLRKRYFAYTRADCVVQHPQVFEKWARIGLELVIKRAGSHRRRPHRRAQQAQQPRH